MRNILIYGVLYLLSFALIGSVFLPHAEVQNISWIQHVIIFTSFIFLTKYLIYMVVSPWYDAK